jgi:PAS domain S-box-containing protein
VDILDALGGTRGGTVDDHDGPDRVVVRTFPTSDLVFAERVRDLLQRELERNHEDVREALETRLRNVYPRVRATIRTEVAGFGDTVIYVFRDGSIAASLMADDWIDDPATARLVSDQAGTYVEANAQAESLFGRSAEEIVSRKAGSFTRPDARIQDADAVWRALEHTGRLHSLAIIRCRDGTETPVEFVTIKDGDGPGRNVTYLRERH